MMRDMGYKRLFDYMLVSLLAIALICISSQIWNLDLNVMPSSSDDRLLGIALFKSIKEYGLKGIWFNNRLGAPEFSSLIDTPIIDYPFALLIWILVNILPSCTMAYYILYFLSYPLSAAAMLFLLKRFSTNRFLNIIMSLIFSIAPYHFMRGNLHSTLSCYYAIPIGLFLALVVFKEEFSKGSPDYLDKRWKKNIFWLAVIFVGLSNVYYSFFSMLIILVAVVYKMIIHKTWQPVFHEARVFYVMALSFLLGIFPKIMYSVIHGNNSTAGIRFARETEIYSLKIIQLLLPPEYSRLGLFRSIADNYITNGFNINENTYASLGFFGVIGFTILCIWVIIRLVKGGKLTDNNDKYLNILACFTLVLVLWCTAGGFGTIFSYLITPELRCLNRSSIMISAISILAFVLISDKIQKKIDKKIFHIVIGLMVLLALFLDFPIYSQSEQQISKQEDIEYAIFFEKVQDSVDKDTMIYQLPMTGFPETPPVNNMEEYALLLGYVYTDDLKWSYGGVSGRNNAAMDLYVDGGMSIKFIEQIMSRGFKGIYIDTFGFEDNGAEINDFYQNVLELKPIISEGNRHYFYNLDQLEQKHLKNADILVTENKIMSQMKNLYYSLNGAELTKEMCEDVAEKCEGIINYGIVYDTFFDNSKVQEISNQRYVREIITELLKRETNAGELKNWSINLEGKLTKKDVFIEICSSEEFLNQ